MRRFFIYSIVFLTSPIFYLNANNFDKAIYEYKKEHFEEALRFFDKSCKNNNKQGCYNLAVMYKFGQGIRPNRHKANRLFYKACGQKTTKCNFNDLNRG